MFCRCHLASCRGCICSRLGATDTHWAETPRSFPRTSSFSPSLFLSLSLFLTPSFRHFFPLSGSTIHHTLTFHITSYAIPHLHAKNKESPPPTPSLTVWGLAGGKHRNRTNPDPVTLSGLPHLREGRNIASPWRIHFPLEGFVFCAGSQTTTYLKT